MANYHLLRSSVFEVKVVIQEREEQSEVVQTMNNHQTSPSFQFPSVEERIEYYMGDWHNRTLKTDDEINLVCSTLYAVNKNVGRDTGGGKQLLFNVQNLIHQLKYNNNLMKDKNKKGGLMRYIEHTLDVMKKTNFSMNDAVILIQGDYTSEVDFMPTVCKTRPSCLYQTTTNTTCSVIIWPLNTLRHYGPVEQYIELNQTGQVTPWDQKKPTLVFRGELTGLASSGSKKNTFKYGQRGHAVMVTSKYNQTDVDVALTSLAEYSKARELEKYIKGRMPMEEQLQYKYLLNIEGNDVSTGLKWQLASNSVVFMPKPRTVSYAMEDLLVPFVHYIPLKDDFSDVMEMLEWARSHDDECQWISKQATEYMKKLWMSEEAKKENKLVMMGLARRYQEQFSPGLQKCFNTTDDDEEEEVEE